VSVVDFPRQALFEDGISGDELLRRIRASGGLATDGTIELAGFASGWAKACWTGDKVHFWRVIGAPVDGILRGRRVREYSVVSACSLRDAASELRPLFGGGNFPRCKRCAAKARR
jgi:hypothetical protein